ncbi:hypothetical protein GCM10010368_18360 [Streptomyces roseiscleroticus]|uniref:Uncharacterized protein n=1 Tax=Streptomyces roseiscleroticus TaxID=1972 RepID=A0ABP5R6N1_9ACTN
MCGGTRSGSRARRLTTPLAPHDVVRGSESPGDRPASPADRSSRAVAPVVALCRPAVFSGGMDVDSHGAVLPHPLDGPGPGSSAGTLTDRLGRSAPRRRGTPPRPGCTRPASAPRVPAG